jgi:CHAT domain-containing protein
LTLPAVQGFTTRLVDSLAGDHDVEDAGAFTKDLFDSAIDRIPAGETICIVPSGPLLQLPFGALPAAGGYLIERNPVAVLPALSLLPYWGKKRGNDTALVLGDSLGDLEGARKEAERVAALLKTKPLIGPSVTRSTVGPALQSCGLLHAAVHAFYNERDPGGSGFWLADGSVFSARDLSEGHVRVRLAVLSACESGVLDVAAADELSGIAASLLLSGVSSVISTLWRIPDDSALQLMTRFYEVVSKGGDDLSRALALAQRALIAEATTRRPYHWAGFQLCGEWRVTDTPLPASA